LNKERSAYKDINLALEKYDSITAKLELDKNIYRDMKSLQRELKKSIRKRS